MAFDQRKGTVITKCICLVINGAGIYIIINGIYKHYDLYSLKTMVLALSVPIAVNLLLIYKNTKSILDVMNLGEE